MGMTFSDLLRFFRAQRTSKSKKAGRKARRLRVEGLEDRKLLASGAIGGHVYLDLNGNGVMDASDVGVSGITLSILGNNGTQQTATSDANGAYSFSGLGADTYRIFETQPSAFEDGHDNVGNGGGTSSTKNVFEQINLADGQQLAGYDFGEIVSMRLRLTSWQTMVVNQAPSFTKGVDQNVGGSAGPQSVSQWATQISPGPSSESGQALNFIVTNNDNGLFKTQPAIAPDGTLTYEPSGSDTGTAIVTVQLHDNGGTANGGQDTSFPQVFKITVTAVNAAPTLSATALNPAFTEGSAAAVSVYSGAAASTVESGQTIVGLTFTVAGLTDGASEKLTVDGSTIALDASSSGTTTTNGMAYAVTVSSGTATVVLSKAAGVSAANINTLVNGISYQNTNTTNPTAGNRVFTLTQIQDSGGTVNGGQDTATLAIASTVNVAVNTAPTLTATPLNPAFAEGGATAVSVYSAANASTVESGQTIVGLTFTVGGLKDGASEKLTVDGSTIALDASSSGTTTTNGMAYTVTVSSGTATVVLSKAAGVSAANINTLVNGISYQNTNTANPTVGNRIFTLTQIQDSGGTVNGGQDTATLTIASTVNVTVNTAPTLTATAVNPSFTGAAVNVYSGAAASTVESGQTIVGLTFTVAGLKDGASEKLTVDGSTIALDAGSSGTTTTNGMAYTVTVSSGTATVVLSKAAGVSAANINTLINGISYQNTNTANPTVGNRVFTLTQIKDSGGTVNGGQDTSTLSIASTVSVVVNTAPTLTATPLNPAFTEGSTTAVGVYSFAAASTVDSGQTIVGLTFTVGGLKDGASEKVAVDGSTIALDASSTGTTTTNGMAYTVTVSSGTATVVLSKTAGVSAANVNTLVNGITYQNSNTTNPTAGNRVFTLTQIKDSGGTANGGHDTATLSIASTVNVAANTAPTLTATAVNPPFTGAAVSVYSGAAASTVESGQTIIGLTFTVGGLTDGASEKVTVDGSTIALDASSSGTTTTNGMAYAVTVSSGTATVALTKAAGVSAANINALVNGISYQNTNTVNPTVGNRVFTLTQVKDSGGTVNGGQDTATLSIASTVSVVVNTAPTLTATALNPSFTEGSTTTVSVYSGATAGTVESGQTIVGLTFTVGGLKDGASEKVTVDGSTIALDASSSGTTTTNGMAYTVTVSSGTATVVLSKAAGVSAANINALVNGISYQNTNTVNPTAGNRVFTLMQIKDSGGTINGGQDTTTLSIPSTVSVVVNTAPTLTATTLNPTFTEGSAAAVSVYSGANASTVESGQTIVGLTFTVGGLKDGAGEQITVDGKTIALGGGSTGTTTTNGMSYTVTVSSGTATVALTKVGGVPATVINALVNGIAYQNTNTFNPTAGNRVVTLTQVKDSGGTVNGGQDTATLSIASTVSVAVNTPPTLTATAVNPTFTEGGAAAVSVYSGANASTVESGQVIVDMTFTVGGLKDGASEKVTVDGSTIALDVSSSGTTTTNGMAYTVTVSSGTATIVLGNLAGVSVATINALVNGITYQDTNTANPTAGNRVFTLTQIQDSGGTVNGGQDTTTLSIPSTVSVVVNTPPTLTTVNTLTGATEDTDFTITYASLAAAANEADVDGDALSFRVEAVTSGTLTKGGVAVTPGTTLLATGESLVWHPATNANGVLDAFTTKAWDGQAASATAVQVKVQVAAVNDAPVRTSGPLASITVDEDSANGTAVTLGLGTVAYGPGGGADEAAQTLSYQVTAIPSFVTLYKADGTTPVTAGTTVTLVELQGLKYKTVADANGTGNVTWTVTDSGSGTAPNVNTLTESLSITVNAVNDAPVRTSGPLASITVDEDSANGTAVTLGLGTVAYGPGGGADEAAQTLSYQVTAIPSFVTLYKADGTTPVTAGTTVTLVELQGLKYKTVADANGTGNVTWTVTDSGSGTAPNVNTLTESLSITVNAVNDAPVRTSGPLASITVDEDSANGTAVTLGLGTVAYGPGGGADEAAQTLSYQVTAIPSFVTLYKADGTTPVTAGTTVTLVELQGLKYKTVADANGTGNVTWTVTDSGSGTAPNVNTLTESLSITVNAVNDAPVRTSGPLASITVDEDSANGTAVTLGLGTVAYGPGGGADEAAQTLSYQVTAIPSFVTLYKADGTTPVTAGTTVTLVELQGLKYKTVADANGTGNVTWTVTDSGSGTAPNVNTLTESLSITVNAVNDAPVRTSGPLASITVDEDSANGTAVTLGLGTVAYGPGGGADEAAQTLSYQVTAIPSFVTLYKADGTTPVTAGTTVTLVELQGLKYKTVADANGTGNVTWTVTDSGSGTAPNVNTLTESLSITVNAVNDAPVRTSGPLASITVDEDSANGTAVTLGLGTVAYGPGGGADEAAQTLSYQVTAIPSFVTLYKADGTTPVTAGTTVTLVELQGLKYKTVADANGTGNVTWTVTDSGSGTAPNVNTLTESLSITVNAVNDAPVRTSGPLASITVDEDSANGTAVTLGLGTVAYGPGGGADEAAQTLSYQVTAIPSFVTLYKADGTTPVTAGTTVTLVELQGLKYKTVADANGTGNVTWTVTDSGSGTAPNVNTLTESLSITVNAVNDAPVRTSGPLASITVDEDSANGTAVTLGLGTVAYGPGGGADEAAQTLSYQVTAIPSFVTLYKADGTTPVTAGTTVTLVELQGLKYKTVADANGTGNVTWTVTDSGSGTAPNVNTLTESLSITVNAVNDAPVASVPGAQTTAMNTALVFSSANGNAITVGDVDVAETVGGKLEVTLSVSNGTLTLSGTTGLTFTTGDGTDDAIMVFTGTVADINAALEGLRYDPALAYTGPATLSVDVSDQGNTGSGGPLSDSKTVAVTVT